MTKREIYLGCAQLYFRRRHALRPRYKSGRRRQVMVSEYDHNCRMVRRYIAMVREIDARSDTDRPA